MSDPLHPPTPPVSLISKLVDPTLAPKEHLHLYFYYKPETIVGQHIIKNIILLQCTCTYNVYGVCTEERAVCAVHIDSLVCASQMVKFPLSSVVATLPYLEVEL